MFQAFFTCSGCLFGPSQPRTPWGARNIPASASASGEINSLSSHMNKISLGSQDRNLLRSATKPTKPPSSAIQIYLQPHHITIPSPNHVTKYISHLLCFILVAWLSDRQNG